MQEREAALYRYFDKNDRLLYVGISKSAPARLAQHIGVSHWAYQITRVNIEKYPNRAAARAAELQAIKNENPVHNIEGRRDGMSAFDARRADSTLDDLKRDWEDSHDLFDCHCRLYFRWFREQGIEPVMEVEMTARQKKAFEKWAKPHFREYALRIANERSANPNWRIERERDRREAERKRADEYAERKRLNLERQTVRRAARALLPPPTEEQLKRRTIARQANAFQKIIDSLPKADLVEYMNCFMVQRGELLPTYITNSGPYFSSNGIQRKFTRFLRALLAREYGFIELGEYSQDRQ